MNLEFNSLVVRNFKTLTGSAPTTLYLGGPGLIFIRGRNDKEPKLGANDCGKTTLFDALTWCLFGRTVSNLRNLDVKPWNGAKGPTHVVVGLKNGEGEYLVLRSASPNKITINQKEVTQQEVDRLLGINFEVWRHTILAGQGQPLFLDLEPKRKMELFNETLNLDRWEVRAEAAGNEVRALERELATVKGEITGGEAALEKIKTLFKQTKTDADEWERERQNRVIMAERDLRDLKAKLLTLEQRKGEADLAYDGAMTELKAIDKQRDQLCAAALEANKARSKAELELTAVRRQGAELEGDLDELGEADECPTCGQPIKGTDLAKHKREMRDKIKELMAAVKKQQTAVGAAVVADQRADEAMTKVYKDRERFADKADKARAERDQVADAVVELRTKCNNLNTVHKERTEETNPYQQQLGALRKQRNQQEDQLVELDKVVDTLNRKIERTKFWVKGFKEVRLLLVEEILEELELSTNAMLPEMGLDDWQVKFAVERETKSGTMQRGLNVTVLSPANDEPVKWEVWGGGVGQRLRIAVTLALSEVLLNHAGVRTNLEILDEPTQHVSVEGVQDMCEFLAERAHNLEKTIFYVDHLAVESAYFDEVLTVVKDKDGRSYIGED